MRNVHLTYIALIVSLMTVSSAHAAPEVTLNSGTYTSGIDQKMILKITSDESGRSLQIQGPHVTPTTLSSNENHNFDTTTALDSGTVNREFIRKCTTKPGKDKPCFKGLYDASSGKLLVREGDEYTVSARLEVLSSDSVLEMQWVTYTRDESMIAQKLTKQVLKRSEANSTMAPTSAGSIKDPVAL